MEPNQRRVGDTASEAILEKAAAEAGVATKFKASEAAEGLSVLVDAGLSAELAAEALPAALDMATASQVSVVEASKAVAAVEAFGESGVNVDTMNEPQWPAAAISAAVNWVVDAVFGPVSQGGVRRFAGHPLTSLLATTTNAALAKADRGVFRRALLRDWTSCCNIYGTFKVDYDPPAAAIACLMEAGVPHEIAPWVFPSKIRVVFSRDRFGTTVIAYHGYSTITVYADGDGSARAASQHGCVDGDHRWRAVCFGEGGVVAVGMDRGMLTIAHGNSIPEVNDRLLWWDARRPRVLVRHRPSALVLSAFDESGSPVVGEDGVHVETEINTVELDAIGLARRIDTFVERASRVMGAADAPKEVK